MPQPTEITQFIFGRPLRRIWGGEPKSGGNFRAQRRRRRTQPQEGRVTELAEKTPTTGRPRALGLGNIPQAILAFSVISPMTMSINAMRAISVVVTIRIISTVVVVYLFE